MPDLSLLSWTEINCCTPANMSDALSNDGHGFWRFCPRDVSALSLVCGAHSYLRSLKNLRQVPEISASNFRDISQHGAYEDKNTYSTAYEYRNLGNSLKAHNDADNLLLLLLLMLYYFNCLFVFHQCCCICFSCFCSCRCRYSCWCGRWWWWWWWWWWWFLFHCHHVLNQPFQLLALH